MFDDTLIMSGANLSEDYFTNRQDRYIVFENCPALCDYFQDLVKTISKFSFSLQSDDQLKLHPGFHHHPYEGSRNKFELAAGKVLKEFTEKYGETRKNQRLELLNSTEQVAVGVSEKASTDTVVFPLLQMRSMGITQEERVIKNIISSAPPHTNMLVATAYFNLTDDYWESILNAQPNIDIIMAHPKAMGFYGAAGMAGGIPNAFSRFSKKRFDDVVRTQSLEKIKFLEYYRDGWTFHGKGMWAHMNPGVDEVCTADPTSPFFTLIGSTNFSKRSVVRDMEAEVGLITTNERLIGDLSKERDLLRSHCSVVDEETYKETDGRTTPWWVYLISTYMSDYF